MKTLDFKENVERLSLQELGESLRFLDADLKLKSTRPVEAYDFLNVLLEKCDKNRLICTLDDIFVHKNGAKLITKRGEERVKTIDNWLFENLITRIQIKDNHNEFNPSVAISYNTMGIAIGFGVNVRVCSNMSILNAKRYIRTWGDSKEQYDRMLIIVDKWLSEIEGLKEEDYAILKAMNEVNIGVNEEIFVYGELIQKAVGMVYMNGDSPFNISQTTKFVREFERKKDDIKTVYDMYNVGTSVLNLQDNDFVLGQEKIISWSEFIINKYLK